MQCINKNGILVPELRSFDDYMKLPPTEKEIYVRDIIMEMLKQNKKKGLTIQQISENTYFHRNTIAYHLDKLLAKGEVYKYPPASRSALFFPNGNFGDPIYSRDAQIGDKLYAFYVMANQLGDFLYIQEKVRDIFGSIDVRGGIMIPLGGKSDFLKALEKVVEDLEVNYGNTG